MTHFAQISRPHGARAWTGDRRRARGAVCTRPLVRVTVLCGVLLTLAGCDGGGSGGVGGGGGSGTNYPPGTTCGDGTGGAPGGGPPNTCAAFSVAPAYGVGREPTGIATVDLDGDGALDVVTVNPLDSSVSVLTGKGDGTFAPAQSHGVACFPQWVTIADANGDGKRDILTAGRDGVTILLGDGAGAFAVTSVGVGDWPASIAVGDFNGDGESDLVTVNNGYPGDQDHNIPPTPSSYSVVLGGSGGFQPAATVKAEVRDIAVPGDFDGDGKLDVVMGLAAGLQMMIGNGDGTFAPGALIPGFGVNAAIAADFDGDGKLDIATGSQSVNDPIDVFLGNGDGTFEAARPISGVDAAHSLAAGDFDGDGKIDLASTSQFGENVLLFLGKGDGTFETERRFATPAPNEIVSGDFDADGKVDVAIAALGGFVEILLGDGAGLFPAAPRAFSVGLSPRGIALGDVDGDGKIDLVSADSESGNISVLAGGGDATFAPKVDFPATTAPDALVLDDFDGDGKLDVAVSGAIDQSLEVLRGNGDGSFQPGTSVPFGAQLFTFSLLSAHVDGDSTPDLVYVDMSGEGGVLIGQGDGTFQPVQPFSFGDQPGGIGVADVDEDGHADVVISQAGGNNVAVFLGDGDGTFQPATITSAGPPGDQHQGLTLGDIDGDSHVDIAVANVLAGSVSILLGKGDGTFTAKPDIPASFLSTALLALLDMNADGHLDLVTASVGIDIRLGHGDGTFDPPDACPYGASLVSFAAADLDADGRLDLVLPNLSASNVLVLRAGP